MKKQKKSTTEEFIIKAKLVHGEKYNYSLVDYVGCHSEVKIICSVHGEFFQTPTHHLLGSGCQKCVGRNKTTEEFIIKAKLVYGEKYDYSLVEYVNAKTKVKIICPIHGDFTQLPNSHLIGTGCKKCYVCNKILSTEAFIFKAKLIHGDKYNYSLVEYVNCRTKVKIICPIHGEFEQVPNYHLSNCGCPACNESRGEREIAKILTKMDTVFERQKTYEDCKNINSLPFDFFLENYNAAVEFQGEQHYKAIKKFGGEPKFTLQQTNDKIKSDYCLTKNIKLIIIPYWDFKNIEKILKDVI